MSRATDASRIYIDTIGTIGAAWFPIIERSQSPDMAAIDGVSMSVVLSA